MKRIVFILSLFLSFAADAQLYTSTLGYGYIWRRGQVDSTLHIPVDNVDTIISILKRDGAIRFNPNKHIIQLWKNNVWNDVDSITITSIDTARWNNASRNAVPVARTLTINGSSFDLSANRTWNVGDVQTSALYSNPSWISALAWSKITGIPTTLSGYGITDGVTNSSLTTTLSGYATTSSLSSGLSTKENTISGGTTSQYWRGDKTFQTLNTTAVAEGINLYYTDSRARNAISAGTGISYDQSTGIITNTAAGSSLNLIAGRGISITGTYPNITISLVTPTINIVTRTLNSNFTINASKESWASYSVTCSVTNPLLVGTSSATAYLEYSLNGGSTWLLPAQNGNSSGVGVTVTVQLTNGQTGALVASIPANALVRIRTATSGTASVTYVTGTEMYY